MPGSTELASPSVEPGCEPRCRACAHREFPPEQSLARKRQWLLRALEPWADRLGEVEASEVVRGYREKTCLRAEWSGGRWRFGLIVSSGFGRERVEELVEIPRCPVQSARVNSFLGALADWLSTRAEASGLRLAFVATSGAFATLVVKGASVPAGDWDFSELSPERFGIEGIFWNLNPSAGKRVFAPRGWQLAWGRTAARAPRGWEYGPASFAQALPELHARALGEAQAFLAPASGDGVVDLCSGVGVTLAMWIAAAGAGRVMGVELGGEACAFARRNAPGAEVLQGRCGDRVPQLLEWAAAFRRAGGRRLVGYVNPPRTGMEPEALRFLGEAAEVERLAYLSCSAGTLNRDLSLLEGLGYAVRKIIPYDFFPNTHHVECLALLDRIERG